MSPQTTRRSGGSEQRRRQRQGGASFKPSTRSSSQARPSSPAGGRFAALGPRGREVSASAANAGDGREGVLALLQKADAQPLTVREISDTLALRPPQRKQLQSLLDQLVLDGELVTIRHDRYAVGAQADLVTGRLEIKRNGDGYLVDIEGAENVRVPRGEQHTALPGDRVVVRLIPAGDPGVAGTDGRVAKVIRVIARARRVIVGTLRATPRFHYVVPLSPNYQQDFYVSETMGAALGDRVVVQFTDWDHSHVNPEAEIIEVIGPADDPSLDTLSIRRHYGLPDAFPESVTQEAESVLARLQNPGPRLDLRERFIFTVDPATARDFDDALSLDRDARGRRVLGVHIADVSHFVTPGSALDREATERGNSVYLPDLVIPMLPEALSNGVCSLNPNQDRMAFSVLMTLDDANRIVHAEFAKSIIRSSLRLTYEQAFAVLKTLPGMRPPGDALPAEAVERLYAIGDLAQALRRQRMTQCALDLERPEFDIVLGPDGMIAGVREVVNDLSHQMVEECMVAANEAVDRELSRRGVRLIHRLHEPPAPEKIEELTAELHALGYRPGDLNDRHALSEFLRTIRETPLARYAQLAVLKSMKRAVYSADAAGHFGLAKKYYAHFTSPIRRYPDLVVHRILAAVLANRGGVYTPAELGRISQHCSTTEQDAERAERELVEIKKMRFLQQQLDRHAPEVYEAAVIRASNFGLIVEIPALDVQGLVHISTLSNGFVRFDPGTHSLRIERNSYTAGSRIKVVVSRVDFEKHRMDFAPAGGTLDGATPGGKQARGRDKPRDLQRKPIPAGRPDRNHRRSR